MNIAGRSFLTIASAHLNNDWAKKRDVAIEAISTLLDTCRDYNVDLIGCDMNQGVALRKTHTTSSLLEAMTAFCQKHGIGVENADFRELLAQAPGGGAADRDQAQREQEGDKRTPLQPGFAFSERGSLKIVAWFCCLFLARLQPSVISNK